MHTISLEYVNEENSLDWIFDSKSVLKKMMESGLVQICWHNAVLQKMSLYFGTVLHAGLVTCKSY